eukprot:scaffold277281_cov42-Prasinocladus_malaysianus.AAC.1
MSVPQRRSAVGGSAAEAEHDLPIDIDYKKLTDWLVSRKRLVSDWRKRLAVLHVQATELSKALPFGLLASIGCEHMPIHYNLCKQVLAKLSDTCERGAAKDWAKVVRVYEKGCVYLGEAAQLICNNTDYEIPYLKKHAASLDSQLIDLERKEDELRSSATAAANSFRDECNHLGIAGHSVRHELQDLLKELPGVFSGCIESCRQPGVADGMDFYEQFTSYSMQDTKAKLPTLSEIIAGSTEPPAEATEADGQKCEPQIESKLQVDWDFDDADDIPAEEMTVNWDIKPSMDEGTAAPVVNWDFDLEAEDDMGTAAIGDQASAGNPEASIDWGIDLAESGTDLLDCKPETEASAVTDSLLPAQAASGHGGDACIARLIADPDYRNCLLENLMELQAFLSARSFELQGHSATILAASVPETLQQIGSEACSGMLSNVNAAVASMSSDRLRQLLMLKTSP